MKRGLLWVFGGILFILFSLFSLTAIIQTAYAENIGNVKLGEVFRLKDGQSATIDFIGGELEIELVSVENGVNQGARIQHVLRGLDGSVAYTGEEFLKPSDIGGPIEVLKTNYDMAVLTVLDVPGAEKAEIGKAVETEIEQPFEKMPGVGITGAAVGLRQKKENPLFKLKPEQIREVLRRVVEGFRSQGVTGGAVANFGSRTNRGVYGGSSGSRVTGGSAARTTTGSAKALGGARSSGGGRGRGGMRAFRR